MQNKNIWIAMVVVAIIALGSYQFPKVQTQVQNVLGAVPTLDGVDNPSVSIGGNKNDIGIDRVDNSLGYTLENSVSCCSKCNYMKKTLNVENFLLHIAKIYNYNKN